jgi:FYVE/RhoGEF/PH domain-containing protein 5/6
VTNTLNESLAAHAQIMSLISLQKATPNLPFSLIVPGRTLLRRATMMKVDRGSDRRVRDILLFSDCLIWISRGGEREDWGVLGEWAGVGLETGQSVLRDSTVLQPRNSKLKFGIGHGVPSSRSQGIRQTGRIRSRSDADAFPVALRPSSSANVFLHPDPALLRLASTPRDENGEERWWYRGRVELLDIEVVVSPIISSPGEERMLEVLSPEGSFTLYTGITSIVPVFICIH